MDIVLANPRGFCAGVDRAIEIVKRAIETLGAPIYVRHEVVHNRYVVDDLKQRGAIFVEELDEVPDDATVIFSAHGVSQAVRNEAARRGLKVFDATCPLVTKVHMEVARQCRAGRDVVLIGHAGHPEVEGTMGQWNRERGSGRIYLVEDVEDVAALEVGQPDNLAYTTQTTLSVDDTRSVIAGAEGPVPGDPGAEERRHLLRDPEPPGRGARTGRAVRPGAGGRLAQQLQFQPPARTGRTRRRRGLPDRRRRRDRPAAGSTGRRHIGVTAGASAPDVLVQGVIDRLHDLGAAGVRELSGRAGKTWCSRCRRNCACNWSIDPDRGET